MTTPWSRTAVVLALIALSCAVQVWVIAYARLPALDTVNFVAHAQLMEREGIAHAWRVESAPPLYPLTMLAVCRVLEFAGISCSWALVAQLASALPLVLCVLPVYWIGRDAVSEAAGWIAALLFTVMTQVARLGSDALSDSSHLLFFLLALAAVGRGLVAGERRQQVAWSVAAGVAMGVALLARAEIWILAPVVLLTPLCVTSEGWFSRLQRASTLGFGLLAGIVTFTSLWIVPVGVHDPHEVMVRLLGQRGYADECPLNGTAAGLQPVSTEPEPWILSTGQEMQFGRKDPTVSIRFHGITAAVLRFASELLQSWQYIIGLLAAIGCWRSRYLWWRPIPWLHANLFVLYSAALLVFAIRHGYLERRHLLPLVAVTLPWAAQGVLVFGQWIAAFVAEVANESQTKLTGRVQLATAATIALLCLSSTLLPMHPGRSAHRQAAHWLCEQDVPGAVLDTVGHTSLYTGRTTYRHEIAPQALADPNLRFVVIETAELKYASRRAATLRELVQRFGTLAATFKPPVGRIGPEVQIYRWSGDRFAMTQGLSYAR